MTSEEQEALSRRYSDDVRLLLPLKGGNIACFNNARELCGIAGDTLSALAMWHSPKAPPLSQEAAHADAILKAAGL